MVVISTRQTEPQHRSLTVDGLARMPDDRQRYELVAGRLDVSPAPKPAHSRVEHRLAVHLESVCPDDIEIFQGTGIDFNARRTHHRIPDLSLFKAQSIPAKYFETPPVLAVEVVSPESTFRDHHTKEQEYAEFGIDSYWTITPHPFDPSIIEFRLDGTEYRMISEAVGREPFETDAPFPVKLVPHWLTADGPWKKHIGGE